MKVLFILSIIIPVGLLTSFRLTGILEGPITISETITLETIRWEFQRPDNATATYINDVVEASYNNDGLTANPRIYILYYVDRPYGSYFDSLRMVFSINSTIINQDGFIESVYVVLNKDQLCQIDWKETAFHFENLSLVERVEGYKSSTKAYVGLTGANHSDSVYFSSEISWDLLTPNNQSHQIRVAYELTYYSGTAYKKIIQPFELVIVGSEKK